MTINILKDQSVALTQLSSWSTYTPVLGGSTAGDGPLLGKYIQNGNHIYFWASWQYGNNSVIGGSDTTLTLPFTAKNSYGANVSCLLFDSSAATYYLAGTHQISNSTIRIGFFNATVYVRISPMVSTAPFTWAINDKIILSGTYEAA